MAAGFARRLGCGASYEDAPTLIPTEIRDSSGAKRRMNGGDLPHRAAARRAKLGIPAQTCRAAIRTNGLGTAMLRRHGLPTVEDLESSQISSREALGVL